MSTKQLRKMVHRIHHPAKTGRLDNGRVHWNGDETCACLWLGERGMSYNTISTKTGLSKGQIRYRLVQKNVRVSSYRNGQGSQGIQVIMGCEFLRSMRKKKHIG